ncbi:uncharacterized protein DUF58 [Marihabitans asiaticum]|uniref:Uncharacterized protein DUF58 n=2 Tax=Marihabitans asiaticum TaxID=415218 RepID=A0A560WFT9_9MICO|nr:uncharacterized protein DUF58 [Marihabitans asiaticum]
MAQAQQPRRRGPSLPSITIPRITLPAEVSQSLTGARRVIGDRLAPVTERTRPWWSPVATALRWVSALGWTIAGLGVLAWWLGARYQWVELTMVAAGCLALVLACVVLAQGRTRVRIETVVDPRRVTVGDPATGRIDIENEGKVPLLPIVVELPVGRSDARFTMPSLRSGEVHEEIFVVPTQRRGVIPVGPARTVQGDPFGLVRRVLHWTDQTELFVHPRTIPLDSHAHGLLRDLEGQSTQDISSSDLAFHALREYEPGDDLRHVHWRSSAKTGVLMVRQFLDTRRAHLAVVVDTTGWVYRDGDEGVELAIEVAASLIVRSIMDDQDGTVVCNDQQASRTTAPLLLDTLSRAMVGPVDLFASVAEAAALAPDASVAAVVTGSGRPFVESQRALGQFGPEVARLVIVVDRGTKPSVQQVAGLTVLTIGELVDLRRVLVSGVAA